MTARSWSSRVLTLAGVVLVALGLYFILVRPALLPEDPRYIGSTSSAIRASVPGLEPWLEKVFWVMGGYMIATGLLTSTIALTILRERRRGITAVVVVAGLLSMGWMAAVNFILDSDFKWVLLGFALLWPIALFMVLVEKRSTRCPVAVTTSGCEAPDHRGQRPCSS